MLKNRLNNLRNHNEDGFTLIELMVVIILIAILAAVAISIFLNQQEEGIKASVKSDVRNTHSTMLTNFLSTNSLRTAALPDTADAKTTTQGNLVSVLGTMSEYMIVGQSAALDGWAWCFDSTTGKYSECASTPAGSPSGDACYDGEWNSSAYQMGYDAANQHAWSLGGWAEPVLVPGSTLIDTYGGELNEPFPWSDCSADYESGWADLMNGSGYNDTYPTEW